MILVYDYQTLTFDEAFFLDFLGMRNEQRVYSIHFYRNLVYYRLYHIVGINGHLHYKVCNLKCFNLIIQYKEWFIDLR